MELQVGVVNLYVGWCGILAGLVAGAIQGSFFHADGWLGGYTSWPRRMARLGHIAFVGLGLINLAYAGTLAILFIDHPNPWPSWLLVIGAVTMPFICYLSAYRKPFRHLFPIPVLSLIAGVALFLFGEVLS